MCCTDTWALDTVLTELFWYPFKCLRYNKLSRNIRDLAQKIRDLDEKDGFRAQSSHQLLEKMSVWYHSHVCRYSWPSRLLSTTALTYLQSAQCIKSQLVHPGCFLFLHISYSIGLVPTKQNLSLTEKVTASSFCRWKQSASASLTVSFRPPHCLILCPPPPCWKAVVVIEQQCWLAMEDLHPPVLLLLSAASLWLCCILPNAHGNVMLWSWPLTCACFFLCVFFATATQGLWGSYVIFEGCRGVCQGCFFVVHLKPL